ncbi:MAG: TetR family transcriptional regulator C-terminal domain-containing protein [Hyphomicrobiales bacterium]
MLTTRRPKRDGKGPARNPARTRESLLRAAFEEIYKSGFRGSDVETILRKAGVTKGAMYHHFDNKEALGYSVVDEVIAEIMREKWQSPLQDAENPVDALIGIVRSTSLKPEHLSCGCPLNNVSQEMSPLDEGFRKRTAKVFNDWRGAVATALQEGKGRGFVRKDIDADETATFLIAAYEGYMSLTKCFQDVGGTRAGLKALIGYLGSLRPHGRDRAARRSAS